VSLFNPLRTGVELVDRILVAAVKKAFDEAERRIRSLDESAVEVVADDFVMSSETVVVDYVGVGGHTIKIPSAAVIPGRRGRPRYVLNDGAGAVTLAAQGDETVNGLSTLALGVGSMAMLMPNGDTKTQAQVASADGTDFHSYRHHVGNSSHSPWYVAGMAGGVNSSGGNPTIDTLFAVPFIAPKRGGTVSAIGWRGTGTTGNGRVGIYSNKAADNLYPDALLAETGSIAQSNAIKSATVSVALTAGAVYWLVYCCSASNTVNLLDPANTCDILGTDGSSGQYAAVKAAFTFGALPSAFPGGGTYTSQGLGEVIPKLEYQI
jgi:hypothetical protein